MCNKWGYFHYFDSLLSTLYAIFFIWMHTSRTTILFYFAVGLTAMWVRMHGVDIISESFGLNQHQMNKPYIPCFQLKCKDGIKAVVMEGLTIILCVILFSKEVISERIPLKCF